MFDYKIMIIMLITIMFNYKIMIIMFITITFCARVGDGADGNIMTMAIAKTITTRTTMTATQAQTEALSHAWQPTAWR